MFGGGIGYAEMILIAGIAVLLFGSKLPEVARSVGQSYTQFRKGLNDIQDSVKSELDREIDEVKKIPQELDAAMNEDQDDDLGPDYDPPEGI